MPTAHQLPSGSWRVQISHRGRRRSVTAPTKREALAAAEDLSRALRGVVVADRPTVGALVARRIETADWAPVTRDGMRRAAKRIDENLMRRRADEVGVAEIEDMLNAIPGSGSSRRQVHSLLSQAFTEGIRLQVLAHSPMPAVLRPKPTTQRRDPPTPEQVRAMITSAPEPFATALALAAATGMRRGELVALTWDRIDLDAARVDVVESLAYTEDEGLHRRPTKTGQAGHRTISIHRSLADRLRSLRVSQIAEALEFQFDPPTWVFSADAGSTPWRPDTVTYYFTLIRRRHGLDGLVFHDLRHFAATQMLSAGVDLRTVAHVLGHSSTRTTERVYAHWIPGDDADAADVMGRLLG